MPDVTPTIARYRPVAATIEAFQYDGSTGYFPLEFLRGEETVRKGLGLTVIVATASRDVHVNPGNWVVRDLRSGSLQTVAPHVFADHWEHVPDAECKETA